MVKYKDFIKNTGYEGILTSPLIPPGTGSFIKGETGEGKGLPPVPEKPARAGRAIAKYYNDNLALIDRYIRELGQVEARERWGVWSDKAWDRICDLIEPGQELMWWRASTEKRRVRKLKKGELPGELHKRGRPRKERIIHCVQNDKKGVQNDKGKGCPDAARVADAADTLRRAQGERCCFPGWPDVKNESDEVKIAWLNNYAGAAK